MHNVARLIRVIGYGAVAFLLFHSVPASAQPYECDDRFGSCGTPEQSGGVGAECVCTDGVCNCQGGGGAILVANTDLGDTYQDADDYDNDGWEDPYDNCIRWYNPEQADSDGDGFGDPCDNCLSSSNPTQLDNDGDGVGNACDPDIDGDGALNADDNCAEIPNPIPDGASAQSDLDSDGIGDACDPDIDGDGMENLEDPCPLDPTITEPTADQLASCFPDSDGDGVSEVDPLSADNCPTIYNPDQVDTDSDGLGNECDPDIDEDGVLNTIDNCDLVANQDQLDEDRDGLGDVCDPYYCYVVFGDEDHCLDPAAGLAVYVPPLLTYTHQSFRLPFFVNRDDQPLEYRWVVTGAPRGSSAVVSNATGEIHSTISHEAVYQDGNTAFFSPDKPGYYEIEITVITMGADNVTGEVGARASYVMGLVADASAGGASGCSVGAGTSPGSAPLWILFAALLAPAVRRRKR